MAIREELTDSRPAEQTAHVELIGWPTELRSGATRHVQQVEPTPDRKTQEREDGRAVRCGRQAAIPNPQVDIITQSTVNEQLSIDNVLRLGARCTGQRRSGRGSRRSTSCQEREPKVEDGGSEFEEEEDALLRRPNSLHRLEKLFQALSKQEGHFN